MVNESIYNNPVRGDKMGETVARKEWAKKNTTFYGLKLQNSTDADIIEWMGAHGDNKQSELKRLLRIAIEIEKQNKK